MRDGSCCGHVETDLGVLSYEVTVNVETHFDASVDGSHQFGWTFICDDDGSEIDVMEKLFFHNFGLPHFGVLDHISKVCSARRD